VSVANVPSYRRARALEVHVPGHGTVTGDVAWGGNWFFLVDWPQMPLCLANVAALTDSAWAIRQAVNAQGYPEVDHIELFGPPSSAGAHSRNFVLCPGRAYDRSPCGTGTSAKLACLAAEGKWPPDAPWIQESILGTTFTARYRPHGDQILPIVTGSAFLTAEAWLLLDPRDPFRWGIR
jgi:proline racemase